MCFMGSFITVFVFSFLSWNGEVLWVRDTVVCTLFSMSYFSSWHIPHNTSLLNEWMDGRKSDYDILANHITWEDAPEED